jgi:hypothetical protein
LSDLPDPQQLLRDTLADLDMEARFVLPAGALVQIDGFDIVLEAPVTVRAPFPVLAIEGRVEAGTDTDFSWPVRGIPVAFQAKPEALDPTRSKRRVAFLSFDPRETVGVLQGLHGHRRGLGG